MQRYVCIVYVSEGVRKDIIEILSSCVSNRGHLAHRFVDEAYNRTSFALCGSSSKSVVREALELCSKAFDSINYSCHLAKHPSLGTVDNICFSPLGDTSMDFVIEEAKLFASCLSDEFKVPCYTYGEASNAHRMLRNIRSELGYFRSDSSSDGMYLGEKTLDRLSNSIVGECKPDFISPDFTIAHGISCVGAVPYIRNLNFRYGSSVSKSILNVVTKHIRKEGYVQAMTLHHEEGTHEVACNLLKPREVTIEQIIAEVKAKSIELDIEPIHSYSTGLSEEDLITFCK